MKVAKESNPKPKLAIQEYIRPSRGSFRDEKGSLRVHPFHRVGKTASVLRCLSRSRKRVCVLFIYRLVQL
jgi:hypothetical protein